VSEDGWTWKIGILNGVGSAAWQELSGKVRRITQLQSVDAGLFPTKCAPSIGAADREPQFDVPGLVVVSADPDPQLAATLDRVWGGLGLVMPKNGKSIPGMKLV